MHNSYTHARKCYWVPFDHLADTLAVVYFSQACVILSIEKAKFWRVLAILMQNFTHFGVLLQVKIMRWCNKIEKYQVYTMVNIWVGPYLLYISVKAN